MRAALCQRFEILRAPAAYAVSLCQCVNFPPDVPPVNFIALHDRIASAFCPISNHFADSLLRLNINRRIAIARRAIKLVLSDGLH